MIDKKEIMNQTEADELQIYEAMHLELLVDIRDALNRLVLVLQPEKR